MKNFRFLTCALLASLAIAACTPTINIRGNLVEDYQLQEISKGQDSRTDVLHKLGSPTTKAPFDDNVWYYLGQRTEKKGILDPKVIKERIVMITFDDNGIVKNIEDVKNHRVNLPYVRDKTPTSGKEVTVMQQFIGNLGKFNKDKDAGSENH